MDEFGLVVGGNSGIGEATLTLLCDKHPGITWLRPTVDTLDVTNDSSVAEYIRHRGPFTHIVYSAGVNELNWIWNLQTAHLHETFAVNVFGFVSIVAAHERRWGDGEQKVSAVAITSDAARIAMRASLSYGSSKAALEAVIRNMARELAPRWRVNGVAPGMVEGTPMTDYIDKTVPVVRGWTPERTREYETSNVPTGRRATVDEIAETVRWVLFGPEQMTGAIIDVNGGR